MILDEKYIKAPKPNTAPKYIGKYVVVKREVNGPYVLKNMHGDIYHRKVPIDQMKILFLLGMKNAMRDDKDVYIVERIVNDEKRPNDPRTWYEIKWKGYSENENTLEPEDHIHDQDLIDKYIRLKTGMQYAKKSKDQRGSQAGVMLLVSSRRNILFNTADQTARTTPLMVLRRADMKQCM